MFRASVPGRRARTAGGLAALATAGLAAGAGAAGATSRGAASSSEDEPPNKSLMTSAMARAAATRRDPARLGTRLTRTAA